MIDLATLQAALRPFADAAIDLDHTFVPQTDEKPIVQIAGTWLTWGDFRRVLAAYWDLDMERVAVALAEENEFSVNP